MTKCDIFEALVSVFPRGKYSKKKLWEVSLIDIAYIESLAKHWEPASVWVEARDRAIEKVPWKPKELKAEQGSLF